MQSLIDIYCAYSDYKFTIIVLVSLSHTFSLFSLAHTQGCIPLWIWLTFHWEQRAGAPVSCSLAYTPKVCGAHLLECTCLYTQGGHLLVLSSAPFAVEVPGCRVMDELLKKANVSNIYSLICWYSLRALVNYFFHWGTFYSPQIIQQLLFKWIYH